MSPKISPVIRDSPTFIEAARRAQIIEAATKTIAELGFMNASLAQIAARAGISKGVIGYYFPTKDDLVRAVVDAFYMAGHVEMLEKLKTATTATELLEMYIRRNLAYIGDHRSEILAVSDIISNFRHPDGTSVYGLAEAEPMVQGTEAVFKWGQQTGEFRQFDTRVMALALRSAIDNVGQQLAASESLDIARYASELADLFQHACRNDS